MTFPLIILRARRWASAGTSGPVGARRHFPDGGSAG